MEKNSWCLIAALLMLGAAAIGCNTDGNQDQSLDASVDYDAASEVDAQLEADADADASIEEPVDGALTDSGHNQDPPDGSEEPDVEFDVGIECTTDDDCHGTGCLECSSTGTCIPCTCRDLEDCPDNMICDPQSQLCLAHCLVTGCPRDRRCSLDIGTCQPIEGCINPSDCPDGEACFNSACVSVDTNNSCQGEPILLEPGVPMLATTMRHRHMTPKPTCTTTESPEAIFSFNLDQQSRVSIVVEGEGLFDPLVYVRRECEDATINSQVICQDWPNLFMEVLDLNLDAGQYFLFVESFSAEAVGNFTVLFDLTTEEECINDPLEPNNTAATAKDINLTRGLPLVLCPQDVDQFLIDLKEGDGLELNLELIAQDQEGTVGLATALLPELSLLDRNESPITGFNTEIGEDGESIKLLLQSTPVSSTYQVRVAFPTLLPAMNLGGWQEVGGAESTDADFGEGSGDGGIGDADTEIDGGLPQPLDTPNSIKYRITYRTTTRDGTTDCVNPTTMEPGIPAIGNTGDGVNFTKGSCSAIFNHQAPEVVYKFSMEKASMVDITMDAPWDADMYLRSTCDDNTTEIDCADSTSSIHQPSLPAGTYYLYVDGHNYDTSGSYQVLLELNNPITVPPNDTCLDSLPILMGQSVQSTTRYAANNYDATCTVRIAHQGPDLVWHFELEEPARVKINLDNGGAWDSAIYLRADCTMRNTEIACSDTGEIIVDLLPGRYYIFADGWSTGYGPFNLTIDNVEVTN